MYLLPHEYTIIGHRRSTVGRYLALAATALAAAIYGLSKAAVTILKEHGYWVSEVVLWPITAGVLYIILHFIFDTWGWKWPMAQKVLGVPDIGGTWDCQGTTLDKDGNVLYDWSAVVTIRQTWEKITVRLQTSQSSSRSMIAALVNEDDNGSRLIWRYANEPKAGETLQAHVGFADIRFNKEGTRGEGDYFNKGRWTFGQMILTRK